MMKKWVFKKMRRLVFSKIINTSIKSPNNNRLYRGLYDVSQGDRQCNVASF